MKTSVPFFHVPPSDALYTGPSFELPDDGLEEYGHTPLGMRDHLDEVREKLHAEATAAGWTDLVWVAKCGTGWIMYYELRGRRNR